MAKRTFNIKPKLTEPKKKALPVQDLSPENIQQIVQNTQEEKKAPTSHTSKKTPRKKKIPSSITKPKQSESLLKRPQGRPKRVEPVKRLSSDLPAELYDLVKDEVKMHGYTLNGFLAKVLREYFAQKNK